MDDAKLTECVGWTAKKIMKHVVDQITTQKSAPRNTSSSYQAVLKWCSFCLQHFFLWSFVCRFMHTYDLVYISMSLSSSLVTAEALKIYGLMHGNREGKLLFFLPCPDLKFGLLMHSVKCELAFFMLDSSSFEVSELVYDEFEAEHLLIVRLMRQLIQWQ